MKEALRAIREWGDRCEDFLVSVFARIFLALFCLFLLLLGLAIAWKITVWAFS